MTNFTTEVYKNKEDGLIGARVIVYDNDKTPINEISIVDEESLKKIRDLLATHNHDDRYYTETEMDTKLNGKMNNDYSESTIESNFFAHKIGNIVIVTWWNPTLPTTQNSWVDWKTLPYKSCNTQPIWVDGNGHGCEVRVRVPPNSNKLQVFLDGGTGGIRPGIIVYPTK